MSVIKGIRGIGYCVLIIWHVFAFNYITFYNPEKKHNYYVYCYLSPDKKNILYYETYNQGLFIQKSNHHLSLINKNHQQKILIRQFEENELSPNWIQWSEDSKSFSIKDYHYDKVQEIKIDSYLTNAVYKIGK